MSAITPVDILVPIASSLLKAFVRGGRRLRLLFAIAAVSITLAIIAATVAQMIPAFRLRLQIIAAALGVIGGILVLGIAAYQAVIEETARETAVEKVAERVREHPDEPQAAWELAIIKLESYFESQSATDWLDICADSDCYVRWIRHRRLWGC
jgi:hypothetical protein